MPLFDLSKSSEKKPAKEPDQKKTPAATVETPKKSRVKKALTRQEVKETIQKELEAPKQKSQDITLTEVERQARSCKLNANVKDIYGCQRCWAANMKFSGKFETRAGCGNQNFIK